ncbi:major facilitator superfamily-domain-containing protein [Mycena amicta]|nr:major facilitator superfamily-domain-containing protein [Mycena amicta]
MAISDSWDDTQLTDPLVAVFGSPSRSSNRSPHSFNVPAESSGAGEREPLLDRLTEKKPFYRPRPLWLVPFVVTAALVRGMTLAPRVEVFTQLSCSRLHHRFNHTESSSLLSSHGQLYDGLDPDPSEFWVIVDPPPSEDEPWSDEETEDDPRRLPSARCMADVGVQADAARLQTMFTTTMGFLSALTTGWWSRFGERHGRTRVLTFSLLGLLLTDLIFVLASTPSTPFSSHGHKLLLLAPIIEGLLGGWSTLQSAISAYISDCTSSGSRASMFSRFSGVLFIGLGIGPILGGWLIRHPLLATPPPHPGEPQVATVTSVFWVAVALQVFNVCIVLFVRPRIRPQSSDVTDGQDPTQDSRLVKSSTNGGVIRKFLSPLSIFLPVPLLVDGTVRKRKDWSLTFLACAMFGYMLSAGLYQIKYLYAGHVYGWGAEQLSYYISFVGTTRAVYLLVILPFIITALKPKPKATKDNNSASNGPTNKLGKPKPTKAHLAREINFDLGLSRLSLLIEALANLAIACGPFPLQKMHSQSFNAETGTSDSTFQNSQALFVFASWLQCMGSGAVPAIQSLGLCILQARSLMSTDAAEVEVPVGTLFGALAVLQASGQMVLGPLMFGLIYSGTVATFPKTVFVTAVGIMVAALTALMLVRSPLSESRTRTLHRISARRQRQISWEEEHRGRSRVSKDLRGYGSTSQQVVGAAPSGSGSV